MNIRALLFLSVVVLLSTACAKLEVREHTSRLNTSVIQYGADLRWGRYTDAYNYHVHRDGSQPEVNLEVLKDIKITSVKAVEPTINNEDATEATVPYQIEYYDERYSTVKSIKQTQNWWYSEDAKRWLIESEFPQFE
ncbi:MAG: hypothetical protein GWO08_11775 [Gammaproteobacteria bacterium]|nr:hypothetical protein [Gammaproteobacteria bacterium]NIO61689.1 hypothetical protein [Gammaproteobacteria bacterium]NIP49309.1 hypothetical protein [Gammaproteobacteria bacterium]NIQ10531.1 hypothetical protein [Gammaproteobacteria bacterium]NIQ18940.1 hypothetical protein [Gammaproteobacteria bacterium]